MRPDSITPAELPDLLLGKGKYFVTTDEVATLLGLEPRSVALSLQRHRESGRIIAVTKGGWVPVPPEYRSYGGPPPINFIDPLMSHLGHRYYVGYLSAADLHGASHQKPMMLQVVTPALLRDRKIGASRVQFIQRTRITDRATQKINVQTGRVVASTPETTVLDLVEAPLFAGGIGNAATVIGELLMENEINIEKLADQAVNYPTSVVQRTGYLVEYMAGEVDAEVDLDPMLPLIKSSSDYVSLEPNGSSVGERSSHWKIVANAEVEHDL